MPSDPNARRDKALENIARELHQTNRLLTRLVQVKEASSGIPYLAHPVLEGDGSAPE